MKPVAPPHPLGPQSETDVVLYIDRSGSMNGYLDAASADSVQTVHASGANLRTLLTRLLAVGGERTSLIGFGDRAAALPALSQAEVLEHLFSQAFYNENNTETEQALALVRTDSQRARVHLVVTDGRRGNGEAAVAQYQRMGEVASWWTASGKGIFAISASMAPFRPVRSDRAGCWQESPEADGRCPLYVFAFIPAAAAERTLAILDAVSDRLYAYPTPADSALRIEHTTTGAWQGSGSVGVVRARPFVLGFRAQGVKNQPTAAEVKLTLHADESTVRFALDDSLTWRLERSVLRREEADWTDAGDVADDWVQPGALTSGAGAELSLPLKVRSYAGISPTLYRILISSTGMPRWVREYEAVRQGEPVRTYGLTALFTQLQPRPSVLGGAFVTVY